MNAPQRLKKEHKLMTNEINQYNNSEILLG